jgi:SAM-dependent methyltransferase
MKPSLLELLACPLCHGDLDLETGRTEDVEIMEGRFECRDCRQEYPLTGGIPRLLPPDIGVEQERTANAFGYEWRHFVEMHPEYEEQFLDWINPLDAGFFPGKLILDAGCGIGRHAHFAARYGARAVVAMDLSVAVETAREVLADLPNAHVVQGDIYHPPFKLRGGGGSFDFIYSIGVLHHLPDPRGGFESLLRFVQPGGTIFGWVYGHENNGVVHHFINPLRKTLTARLPRPVVNVMAFPMTAALQGVVKGVYRPLEGTAVWRRLPSHEYLTSLARFGFRQNHSIVFDHLVAPTAFYLRREEYEAWFRDAALDDIEITWRNGNSWRGRGRRPAPAPVGG